jgi:hypothetical protein
MREMQHRNNNGEEKEMKAYMVVALMKVLSIFALSLMMASLIGWFIQMIISFSSPEGKVINYFNLYGERWVEVILCGVGIVVGFIYLVTWVVRMAREK